MASWQVKWPDYRRPCIYESSHGKLVRCLWHGFSTNSYIVPPSLMVGGHNGGTVSEPVAIIEFENGMVEKVPANKIRFDDMGSFNDFAWRSDYEGEDYDEYESDKEYWDSVWNEQDRWEEGFDPGDFELEEE